MDGQESENPKWQASPLDIVKRILEIDGESVVNLIRILALLAFYGIESLNYHGLELGWITFPKIASVDTHFHNLVSLILLAWTMLSFVLWYSIKIHFVPKFVKYFAVSYDALMLTTLLFVADGPKSPIVLGYGIIVVTSALRFNIRLVRYTTVFTMVLFLTLCVVTESMRPEFSSPHYFVAAQLVTLGLIGVILGQILRKAILASSILLGQYRQAEEPKS